MSQITSWVDAHHHLWDLDAAHHPWLAAKGEKRFFGQPDSIRKNYLLADFANDHQQKIGQSVHIQVGASHSLEDTAFIHHLSQSTQSNNIPFPSAAVVAIDMHQPSIEQQLTAHLCYGITRGVRDIIGKSPEENKFLPEFIPSIWLYNWQCLASKSISFDLQLTSEQYQIVLKNLEKVPELKVAICHFASPWDQSKVGFDFWKKQMKAFAHLPNCYMKLSGFSMFKHAFDPVSFQRYAHAAIEIFGPERCMFGSNFPVDKLYISYADLFIQWQKITSVYNNHEANALAANTASNFYQLPHNLPG
jgi:predicted TIM-barrel fold metal-dependent hydrolase